MLTNLNRTILHGSVMEKIKEIPNESIDTVITSPPYLALRNYSMEGQWGLEPDFRDYLAHLRELMVELKRVLKPSGSVWVNLGDTYAGSGKGAGGKDAKESFIFDERPKNNDNIKDKSRYGIPERFFINCIDDGWIARNHIPWYKENAMPSSVHDRFTNKWESIFFLVKNKKYYFDLDAVRVTPKAAMVKPKKNKKISQKSWKNKKIHEKSADEPDANTTRLHRGREGNPNKTWDESAPEQFPKMMTRMQARRDAGVPHDLAICHPKGKNPGDVFFINTKPDPAAHFATFPEALPEKILRCACPPNGIVLDPFFGSGTTAVAAEKQGKQWVGIEINEDYIKVAEKKLKPYMNQKLFV